MHLEKFVNSRTGRIISSILLGVGFATLFRSVCKGQNCRIYYAPHLEDVKDKSYKYNGKCFKYKINAVECDKKKQIYKFE
jgi:hypothetical protein